MLSRQDAILVVIDIQERLLPAMNAPERVIKENSKLIKGSEILGVPHIFTQQYSKGLGETLEEIRNSVNGNFSHVEKTTFSAYQTPEFVEELERLGRKQVILTGIEAHVCVMQTAFDLLDAGYEVFLVTDGVASRFISDEKVSIDRMKDGGAKAVTAEMALFELLRGAKEEGFKDISNLVK